MKTQLFFPGGPTINADVLKKTQRLAVHKTVNGKKGYTITDISSLKCITWMRTQTEAKKLRKEIEELSLDAVLHHLVSYPTLSSD